MAMSDDTITIISAKYKCSCNAKYEGRSINKLQNGVTLVIFRL